MVDFEYQDLFLESSIDKQMTITCEDGSVITNKDLYLEDFTLNESLCSENSLVFGTCEASSISFRVKNIYNTLKDQWLAVKTTLDNNSDAVFQYGKYKVFSDTPSADRSYRDIVAYDVMYDIINADVKEWYNGLSFPITLKNFRKSFAYYFGLQEVTQTLCNDDLSISKTLSFADTDTLSGKTIINAIAEINGVFGHITRDNKIKYVALKENNMALFPRDDLYPADDLFPKDWDNYNYNVGSKYSDCTYEDYMCDRITKLSICGSDDGVATSAGVDGNEYKIVGNFLISDKNTGQLQNIAQNILDVIKVVDYRAYNCKVLRGNPCLEVGDSLRISTENCLILSYVLQRTMTGIHALKDAYEAKGSKEVENAVNSIQSSFTSINNKFHKVNNTLEEFSSEIYDGDGSSKIQQTANAISTEVSNRQSADSNLSSRISQTASSISLNVDNGSTVSSISLTITKEDGSVVTTQADEIKFNGLVSFTDLSGTGTTIINGSNITTGTISAKRIDVDNLTVKRGNFTETFKVEVPINDNSAMIEEINNKNVIIGMNGGYYLKFGNDGSFGLFNNSSNKIVQTVFTVNKETLKSFKFDLDFSGKIKMKNWVNDDVWDEGYPILTGINNFLPSQNLYYITSIHATDGMGVLVRSSWGTGTPYVRYIPTGNRQGYLDNLTEVKCSTLECSTLKCSTFSPSSLNVGSGSVTCGNITASGNIYCNSGALYCYDGVNINNNSGWLGAGHITTNNDFVQFEKAIAVSGNATITGYVFSDLFKGINTPNQCVDIWGLEGYGLYAIGSYARNCLRVSEFSSDGNGLYVRAQWGVEAYSAKKITTTDSDARLKHNIEETEIDDALDVINQIELKSFDWKNGRGHQKIGFIAQQMEEIDKDLVDSSCDYKSINNFYLQGYEVKAIQELSEQNKLLMSQNVSLKNEIDMLKSLLKEKGVI